MGSLKCGTGSGFLGFGKGTDVILHLSDSEESEHSECTTWKEQALQIVNA